MARRGALSRAESEKRGKEAVGRRQAVNRREVCMGAFRKGATPSRASRHLEIQETSCEALVIITSGAWPPSPAWACVSQGGRAVLRTNYGQRPDYHLRSDDSCRRQGQKPYGESETASVIYDQSFNRNTVDQ